MKKVILFGKTSLGKRLKVLMERDSGLRVEAYCMTEEYFKENDSFCDRPVVRFEDLNKLYGEDGFEIYLTIRFGNMNESRAKAYELCKQMNYEVANYIHPFAKNFASKMGEGNIVFPNVYIADFAEIGNGNIIWYDSFISSDTKIGNFNWLVHVKLSGSCKIGNNCFMGNSSGTTNAVHIGNYNLIGAGAMVNQDTEDYTVVLPYKNTIIKNMRPEIMFRLLIKPEKYQEE